MRGRAAVWGAVRLLLACAAAAPAGTQARVEEEVGAVQTYIGTGEPGSNPPFHRTYHYNSPTGPPELMFGVFHFFSLSYLGEGNCTTGNTSTGGATEGSRTQGCPVSTVRETRMIRVDGVTEQKAPGLFRIEGMQSVESTTPESWGAHPARIEWGVYAQSGSPIYRPSSRGARETVDFARIIRYEVAVECSGTGRALPAFSVTVRCLKYDEACTSHPHHAPATRGPQVVVVGMVCPFFLWEADVLQVVPGAGSPVAEADAWTVHSVSVVADGGVRAVYKPPRAGSGSAAGAWEVGPIFPLELQQVTPPAPTPAPAAPRHPSYRIEVTVDGGEGARWDITATTTSGKTCTLARAQAAPQQHTFRFDTDALCEETGAGVEVASVGITCSSHALVSAVTASQEVCALAGCAAKRRATQPYSATPGASALHVVPDTPTAWTRYHTIRINPRAAYGQAPTPLYNMSLTGTNGSVCPPEPLSVVFTAGDSSMSVVCPFPAESITRVDVTPAHYASGDPGGSVSVAVFFETESASGGVWTSLLTRDVWLGIFHYDPLFSEAVSMSLGAKRSLYAPPRAVFPPAVIPAEATAAATPTLLRAVPIACNPWATVLEEESSTSNTTAFQQVEGVRIGSPLRELLLSDYPFAVYAVREGQGDACLLGTLRPIDPLGVYFLRNICDFSLSQADYIRVRYSGTLADLQNEPYSSTDYFIDTLSVFETLVFEGGARSARWREWRLRGSHKTQGRIDVTPSSLDASLDFARAWGPMRVAVSPEAGSVSGGQGTFHVTLHSGKRVCELGSFTDPPAAVVAVVEGHCAFSIYEVQSVGLRPDADGAGAAGSVNASWRVAAVAVSFRNTTLALEAGSLPARVGGYAALHSDLPLVPTHVPNPPAAAHTDTGPRVRAWFERAASGARVAVEVYASGSQAPLCSIPSLGGGGSIAEGVWVDLDTSQCVGAAPIAKVELTAGGAGVVLLEVLEVCDAGAGAGDGDGDGDCRAWGDAQSPLLPASAVFGSPDSNARATHVVLRPRAEVSVRLTTAPGFHDDSLANFSVTLNASGGTCQPLYSLSRPSLGATEVAAVCPFYAHETASVTVTGHGAHDDGWGLYVDVMRYPGDWERFYRRLGNSTVTTTEVRDVGVTWVAAPYLQGPPVPVPVAGRVAVTTPTPATHAATPPPPAPSPSVQQPDNPVNTTFVLAVGLPACALLLFAASVFCMALLHLGPFSDLQHVSHPHSDTTSSDAHSAATLSGADPPPQTGRTPEGSAIFSLQDVPYTAPPSDGRGTVPVAAGTGVGAVPTCAGSWAQELQTLPSTAVVSQWEAALPQPPPPLSPYPEGTLLLGTGWGDA